MQKLYTLILFGLIAINGLSQSVDTLSNTYFINNSREAYIEKLVALQAGIKPNDPVQTIIQKLGDYLMKYKPNNQQYQDDTYALKANIQAWKSVNQGGYGIGAILIDSKGSIIASNHNQQIQKNRSDLHGEMSLLSFFENSTVAKKYMNRYQYKPGLTVFSSAEPCPMCFIRLTSAGVNTRYATPGPSDGMAERINCLPSDWQKLAKNHPVTRGNCSPEMQKLAHLLFYSFLLDNR